MLPLAGDLNPRAQPAMESTAEAIDLELHSVFDGPVTSSGIQSPPFHFLRAGLSDGEYGEEW